MSTPRTPPTEASTEATLTAGPATRPSTPEVTARSPAAPIPAASLNRVRWAIRATLLLGVAASVTANVLHAQPNLISKAIAAWPPLALLLTVELISKVPVHRRSLAAVRLLTTTAIAGIAAYVSYWHMVAVADRYGETGVAAYLLPLSVDGLIVVASISLVELAGRINAPAIPAPRPQAAAAGDARAGLPEPRPATAAQPHTPPAAKPGDGRAEQCARTPIDRPARTFVLPDRHAHNGWAHPAPANGQPVPNGLRLTPITTTDARPPGQRPAADGGDACDEPHEGHSCPDRATSVDPDRERGRDPDVAGKGEDHHSGAAAEHSEAEPSAAGDDAPGEPHERHDPSVGTATDDPDDERDPDSGGGAARDDEENHGGGQAAGSPGEPSVPHDDRPPQDTAAAVAFWHRRHPDWGPKQIAAKIDKSERTVRRWLPDKADTDPAKASRINGAAVPRPRGGQPAD